MKRRQQQQQQFDDISVNVDACCDCFTVSDASTERLWQHKDRNVWRKELRQDIGYNVTGERNNPTERACDGNSQYHRMIVAWNCLLTFMFFFYNF